jgi:uncharacterized protein HemX
MLSTAPIVLLLLLLIALAAVRDGFRYRTQLMQQQQQQQQQQQNKMTVMTLHAKQQKLSQTEDDGYSLSHKLQSLRLLVSKFFYKTTPGQLILVRHGTLLQRCL